jgi:hypothetical protein
MAKRQRTMRDMLFRAGAALPSLQPEPFQAASTSSSTAAAVSTSTIKAEKLKKWQDSWF